MDWSSITRFRGEILILVGFILLVNPVIVNAYDIGDPDWYRYEASEVEFYDNGTYDYETKALPLDSEVAYFEASWSRSCVLQRGGSLGGVRWRAGRFTVDSSRCRLGAVVAHRCRARHPVWAADGARTRRHIGAVTPLLSPHTGRRSTIIHIENIISEMTSHLEI